MCTPDLLYSKWKLDYECCKRKYDMISNKHSVSPGFENRAIYTKRIAPKDDYYQKRRDSLAKTSIAPLPENLSTQKNLSNKASVSRGAVPMSTNSAFNGLLNENPFCF